MRIITVGQDTAPEQKVFLKASGTVIPANSLVTLSSGLIVAADAASTSLAYCVGGAASGVTELDVVVGNNYEIELNADANFAATDRGAIVDLVVSGTEQKVDLGESTTDVFVVTGGKTAGTVGSASNVRVRINKPIF